MVEIRINRDSGFFFRFEKRRERTPSHHAAWRSSNGVVNGYGSVAPPHLIAKWTAPFWFDCPDGKQLAK